MRRPVNVEDTGVEGGDVKDAGIVDYDADAAQVDEAFLNIVQGCIAACTGLQCGARSDCVCGQCPQGGIDTCKGSGVPNMCGHACNDDWRDYCVGFNAFADAHVPTARGLGIECRGLGPECVGIATSSGEFWCCP